MGSEILIITKVNVRPQSYEILFAALRIVWKPGALNSATLLF